MDERTAAEASDFYDRLYQGWYKAFEGGIEVEVVDRWTPGRLLDVGCGKGAFLEQAAARGFEVSGVDISQEALDLAAELAGGATLARAEAEHLPFDDATFDYVTCLGSLEHFADVEASAREMARVLKPGGHAYIVVPSSHHLEAVYNAVRYGISGHDGQMVERLATCNQWRETLEGSGLRVRRITKMNKRPPLRPVRIRSLALRAARPFIPLNFSYLFAFECTPAAGHGAAEWGHRITELRPAPKVLEPGAKHRVRHEVRNTGYRMWLTPSTNLFPVNLGWIVKNGDGEIVAQGRSALSRPVRPGERRRISSEFVAPDEPGEYEVTIDMVREGEFWFADTGSDPIRVKVRVGS